MATARTFKLSEDINLKVSNNNINTIKGYPRADVWVPSELDREAISGCLQLPSSFFFFSFFFSTPKIVQLKALERLMLDA